ncbi:MAG: MFS transporter [Actinobacteria bacterium]|nr:MFS transporter [Actinomycetota bacterium]
MRAWKGAFVALFVCSWAGNQFTPLLLMYKQVDGYSTVVVNAFLGVYVLALAPSLLVAGPLSDRYGRRPVMFAGAVSALATSIVLALGFLGPAPIYVGRLLAGITVGTAMAVGTSWLKELSQAPYDPTADAGSGARRASLAFSLGSALGAGVAGALAQWGPAPEVLPYLAHILIAIPPLFLVRRIPETSPARTDGVPLRASLRVPAASHRRFTRVVVVAAPWIFGLAALAYGYVPVLLRDRIGGFGIAYATLLTVVSLTVAALVQPVAKRLDAVDTARGLITAMVTLTVSVAGVGLVAVTSSPFLGIVTAATSGAGIGIALSTGLLEVQRIAGPRHLAGLTGVFYAVAYLGFLTPTAMAAITPPFTTPQLFAALVVLAVASTTVVVLNSRRHLPVRSADADEPALLGAAA